MPTLNFLKSIITFHLSYTVTKFYWIAIHPEVKMNFKLSLKDINFLAPLFWYLGFFMVTPWYDFHSNSLTKPTLCKLYGLFLALLKTGTSVYSTMDENFTQIHQNIVLSRKILFLSVHISSLVFILLTILKCSFWDVKLWQTLITNFRYIDTKLQNTGKTEQSVFRNFYCQFFATQCVLFLIIAYTAFNWISVVDTNPWKILLFGDFIETYITSVMTVLITTLARVFKIRYEELNTELVRITRREKFVTREVVGLTKIYRLLGDTVEVYNKIFGYQLVLIVLQSGLQIVHCLNFILELTTLAEDINYRLLFGSFSLLFWTLVNIECFLYENIGFDFSTCC